MILNDIHRMASIAPGKPALLAGWETISYGGLWHASMNARAVLRHLPVPQGRTVAVFLASGVQTWPVLIALQSLGLTTIALPPLNSGWLRNVPDLAGLVSSAAFRQGTGWRHDGGLPLIDIDMSIWAGAERPVGGPPEIAYPPGDHILLTSGTTGDHKLFLATQRGEVAHITHRRTAYELTETSVVWGGDFRAWTSQGYHLPLAVWAQGGTYALYNTPEVLASLRRPEHTHLHMTIGYLAEAMKLPAEDLHFDPNRFLTVGAGPMPRALAELAMTRLTPRLYLNLTASEVGPIGLTLVTPDSDLNRHRILPWREVQVVGDDDRVLPAGRIGHVRVRTEEGITGYINNEEASRAAFRDGYFYSGDLGVLGEDGCLELNGRASDVINLAGEKISPAPLEAQLRNVLNGFEVCIFAETVGHLTDRLHVVAEAAQPLTAEQQLLARNLVLPNFADVRFHHLPALPRNETSKVVRREVRRLILGEQA